MLILFTDYGWHDPYVGQVKAVLASLAPGVPVIDLLHAVPDFNAHAGAHLLAALCRDLPSCENRASDSQRSPRPLAGEGLGVRENGHGVASAPCPFGAVVLAVVDPGVGGPRSAVVLEAEGRFYVGPDNGLLSVLAGRAQGARIWRITWRPEVLTDSFHGRDLFAPIAAWIAAGNFPDDKLAPVAALEVQFDLADLARILYVDHYGNAWTGIRGGLLDPGSTLTAHGRTLTAAHESPCKSTHHPPPLSLKGRGERRESALPTFTVVVKGHVLPWRRVFMEAEKGEAFWHVNSSGLIEIAANRANAAEKLGLKVGDGVRVAGTSEGQRH